MTEVANSGDNYLLQQCYHCGNKGLMKILYSHSQEFGGLVLDEIGNMVDIDMEEEFHWVFLICPVCNKPTLFQRYTCEAYKNYNSDTEIIYPVNSFDSIGVPPKIQSAFEAALKIKNIDTAICALSLRRTIEAICKEKNAKGKTLEAMIKHLVESNVLPAGFDDACLIIRKLGNAAAHADGTVIYSKEIEKLIDFVRTIIYYLYSLPVKMEDLLQKVKGKDDISDDVAQIE